MLPTSARLLRLLSLLQSRRAWAGADLARRLEITTRTLRRDVDRLRLLGYPVAGQPGVAGGYALDAGAQLPPLALLAERLMGLGDLSARLVVQANKQDQHGVLQPTQVREALGFPDDVRVVGARATLGIGVRETAVFAVRCAVDLARRTISEGGLEALDGEVETADQLLERLAALDAAQPSQDVDGSVLELDKSLELPEIESPPSDRQVTLPAVASLTPPAPTAGPAVEDGPPWPRADAVTGMIWPAVRGREVVAALDPRRAERRRDGDHPDAVVFHVGPWRLETSPYRRYGTETEARVALSHLAWAKVSLGRLLPTDTVLPHQRSGRHQARPDVRQELTRAPP